MLELRPNCEWCDCDLPPEADNARICSYECTYCADCAENILKNVCPTCGGDFAPRPIRPQDAYHDAPRLGLQYQPASDIRVHSRWKRSDANAMVERLEHIAPKAR